MALNLKTLTTRTITAFVFVAVLLSCIMFNYISFAVLFFIVAIWGLYEFYQLVEKLGAKPYKIVGLITGAVLMAYAILINSYSTYIVSYKFLLPIVFVCIFFVFITALFDKKQNTVLNIAYTLMGLVYTILPFTLLIFISCINTGNAIPTQLSNSTEYAPYNYHYVLGIMLLIWASDSGAYLVGSLIGKNKLYERISPGKTWEGSIGSALLNIVCAYFISNWYLELSLTHWIVISILVSVFGTVGDLVESMLKRQAGIKDSGKIMPGHGGILDRFDSLLFVSPFIYLYLILIS